jgi:ABC-type xylose transport system permease subunit
VKAWWQRRPLRVRLAVLTSVAGLVAGAVCGALGDALGIWEPADLPHLLATLGLIWACVIVFVGVASFLIARRMLAPLDQLVRQIKRGVTRDKPDCPIGLITRSELWAALETAKEGRAGRLAKKETEAQSIDSTLSA